MFRKTFPKRKQPTKGQYIRCGMCRDLHGRARRTICCVSVEGRPAWRLTSVLLPPRKPTCAPVGENKTTARPCAPPGRWWPLRMPWSSSTSTRWAWEITPTLSQPHSPKLSHTNCASERRALEAPQASCHHNKYSRGNWGHCQLLCATSTSLF